MDNPYIHRQMIEMKKNLFDKGYLEEEKFEEFEKMKERLHPTFVEMLMYLFFKDMSELVPRIEQALKKNTPDFRSMSENSRQIKSCCNASGAARIRNANDEFFKWVQQNNIQSCKDSFSILKAEVDESKQVVSEYFQMLRAVTSYEMAERRRPSTSAALIKEIYEALRIGLVDFATLVADAIYRSRTGGSNV